MVLEYSGLFQGFEADFTVTSTFGHIFDEDFESNNIKNHEVEKLFEANIKSCNADDTKNLPKEYAKLANDMDCLVLWLDCDYEGEAICYEVIKCVEKSMNKPPTGNLMDVIYRAKFSAADDAINAIENLGKPNFLENLANIAKHDLDLRIGVVFSRFQTHVLRRAYPNKDIKHISFGPCQTPCLSFVVERYKQIIGHERTVKYHIVIDLNINGEKLQITSKPFDNEKEAEQFAENLKVGLILF